MDRHDSRSSVLMPSEPSSNQTALMQPLLPRLTAGLATEWYFGEIAIQRARLSQTVLAGMQRCCQPPLDSMNVTKSCCWLFPLSARERVVSTPIGVGLFSFRFFWVGYSFYLAYGHAMCIT
ncbi:hypothetical protein ACMFMF_011280 [Clarireedia jacksonii]